MLNVVLLNAANKPLMLSVIILSFIILSVIILSVLSATSSGILSGKANSRPVVVAQHLPRHPTVDGSSPAVASTRGLYLQFCIVGSSE